MKTTNFYPTKITRYTVIVPPIYSFSQASSSTRTWLDKLRCLGTESRLIDCPRNAIGVEDCTHTQDVALVCVPYRNFCMSHVVFATL